MPLKKLMKFINKIRDYTNTLKFWIPLDISIAYYILFSTQVTLNPNTILTYSAITFGFSISFYVFISKFFFDVIRNAPNQEAYTKFKQYTYEILKDKIENIYFLFIFLAFTFIISVFNFSITTRIHQIIDTLLCLFITISFIILHDQILTLLKSLDFFRDKNQDN